MSGNDASALPGQRVPGAASQLKPGQTRRWPPAACPNTRLPGAHRAGAGRSRREAGRSASGPHPQATLTSPGAKHNLPAPPFYPNMPPACGAQATCPRAYLPLGEVLVGPQQVAGQEGLGRPEVGEEAVRAQQRGGQEPAAARDPGRAQQSGRRPAPRARPLHPPPPRRGPRAAPGRQRSRRAPVRGPARPRAATASGPRPIAEAPGTWLLPIGRRLRDCEPVAALGGRGGTGAGRARRPRPPCRTPGTREAGGEERRGAGRGRSVVRSPYASGRRRRPAWTQPVPERRAGHPASLKRGGRGCEISIKKIKGSWQSAQGQSGTEIPGACLHLGSSAASCLAEPRGVPVPPLQTWRHRLKVFPVRYLQSNRSC